MIEVNTSDVDSIASAISAYELPITPAIPFIAARIILAIIPIIVVLIPCSARSAITLFFLFLSKK